MVPAVSTADDVYHIAGTTRGRTDNDFKVGNVEPTRALLEALSGSTRLRKFCFVSSLTAVGPTPPNVVWTEESICNPRTAYGRSKREAELLCLDASRDLPVVIIRPPAVYGPRDRDIRVMLQWIQRGISPRTAPPRKQLSMIHVRDLVRAIILAANTDKTNGEVFFAADPSPYWYHELTEISARLLRKKYLTVPIPMFVIKALARTIETLAVFASEPPLLHSGKVYDLYAPGWACSAEKIERIVGFRSEMSISEGLQDTIEWYRSHAWL